MKKLMMFSVSVVLFGGVYLTSPTKSDAGCLVCAMPSNDGAMRVDETGCYCWGFGSDCLRFEGYILKYDERFCEKCIQNARELADSLHRSNISYELLVINNISKRRTALIFRDFPPKRIIYDEAQSLCLGDYPQVSLIRKTGNDYVLVRDLTL